MWTPGSQQERTALPLHHTRSLCIHVCGKRGGWQSPPCRAKPSQAVPCQLQELSGSLGLVVPALGLVSAPAPFPTANVPKSCLGATGQGTLGFPPRPAAQREQHSRGQSHAGSRPARALRWAPGLGLLLAHARSWTGPEAQCHEGRTSSGIALPEPRAMLCGRGAAPELSLKGQLPGLTSVLGGCRSPGTGCRGIDFRQFHCSCNVG